MELEIGDLAHTLINEDVVHIYNSVASALDALSVEQETEHIKKALVHLREAYGVLSNYCGPDALNTKN